MKCSICGAKLKKEGDICSNCYKEYLEDEEVKHDINEIFKIKRKYSISYEILKYLDVITVFIITMIIFLIYGKWIESFLALFLLAIVLGILLFIDKRIAKATSVTFYEKKVVYRFNLFKINKTKVVKYKDLKDVSAFQTTFRKKKMGMGDICFYAKGAIPGATLLNGFQIKDVENAKEVLEKINEIIGEYKT